MNELKQIMKTEFKEMELGELIIDMHQGINTVADKIEYKDKGYPIIQSKNITKSYLDLKDVRFVDNTCYNKYKEKYNPEIGNILICNIGTIGKSLIVERSEHFLIAWNLFLVKLKEDIIIPKYLKFYLDKLESENYYSKILTGGTVKFINKGKMGEILIPIPYKDNKPDLETQKRIVEKLELVEKLKENREKGDVLTREYLNSVFLDMFGDPRSNPKGFEVKKLKGIAKINRESITSEKILNNTKYVGLEHIEKETGIILNYEIVNNGELKSNKFIFNQTMLLYGKLRPYLNKIAIPYFSGICSTDILPILPLENKSNRIFLVFLLRQDYYINLATTRSTGANLPRLSPSALEDFELIAPPITLQNQFAEIVEEIEKLKKIQEKSKEEINNLYNKLMQNAFKGEL